MNTTIAVTVVTAMITVVGLRQTPIRPAIPVEPIRAITQAVRTHQLVALSDGTVHADESGHRFRMALLHDPEFVSTVDDLVVEWGNARYQAILDRFVAGEEVPTAAIARIHRDTTQPTTVWDRHMYEGFFTAVRDANKTLPATHQLRVVLGDPPVDWDTMTAAEIFRADRDGFAAEAVRREVLSKGRRALLIFGAGHLQRSNIVSNYDMSAAGVATVVSLLEADPGLRVFSILGTTLPSVLEPESASWPRPSLIMLRGTRLGAQDFARFFPQPVRILLGNGGPTAVPTEQWRVLPVEEQFDALWYPGPTIDTEPIPPELCADAEYMRMRLHRLSTLPLPPSGRPGLADTLNAYCALQQWP